MEVLYDLDTEARELCERLGVPMQRAATVGTHPQVCYDDSRADRRAHDRRRRATGARARSAPSHDVCPGRLLPLHADAPRGPPIGVSRAGVTLQPYPPGKETCHEVPLDR